MDNKSRTQELLFNTVIIGIGKFSTQIIGFFFIPIYTSILTTIEYGTYDYLLAIAGFITPIITMLMEESMFRFLIDCKTEEERTGVLSNTIVFCIVSTGIWCLGIAIVGSIFGMSYLYSFLLYIVSVVIVSLRNSLTRGLSKIKLYSLSSFATSVLVIILNIILVFVMRLGVYGLLFANICANILSSALTIFCLRKNLSISFRSCSPDKIKEMILFSMPLVPNSISWNVIDTSDRMIISAFLGSHFNGIFSMAHKFPVIVNSISSFFYTAWKETSAKVLNDGNPEEFYNAIYQKYDIFVKSMVIGVITLLPMIFPVMVKNEFAEAYVYVPVLLVAIYLANMAGFYGGIFSAYKNTKIMGTTTALAATINVAVDLILITKIGLWAAALSTMVSNLYVYVARRKAVKAYVSLELDKKEDGVLIALLAVALAMYYSQLSIIYNVVFLVLTVCVLVKLNLSMFLSIPVFEKMYNSVFRKGRK